MSEVFDPLYAIFERHLHSGVFDQKPEDDLVDAVVHEYLLFLVRQGVAPHTREDSLKADIASEVRDMIKMKTYGHFSLRHYNLAKRRAG